MISTRDEIRLGAESAKLSGAAIDNRLEGYAGEGYIDNMVNDGDYAEWTIEIPESGWYRIAFRYAAVSGDKPNDLIIDSFHFGHLLFPQSNEFIDLPACAVLLEAGSHTVRVQKFHGHIQLNELAISRTSEPARPTPSFGLNNPQASPEAVKLMEFFSGIYGKKMLTGQHTSAASGPEIDFIHSVTGRYPAMRGFDLLSCTEGIAAKDLSESAIDEIENNKGVIDAAIAWAKEQGGIVEICWHWFSPIPGSDKSFYTKSTDFDLNAALEPGTPEHEAIERDLHAVARELTRLQQEGIPVLWRPLHEADGRWFWWGAKGPEPFIRLYRWMHDLYTNHYGLNNLIWIWNAPHPDWNPGFDIVDIAGADIYVADGNYGPLACEYERMIELTEGSKPIALTENGPIPDPDLMLGSKSPWLWYMPWWGHHGLNPVCTSPEHLNKVYHHPAMITLDQLQDYWK